MLNFKELLIGGKASQTLMLTNSEHIPFAYAFDSLADDAQVAPRSRPSLISY